MIFLIILLSLLGTLGYFGADMYLPAFPAIQSYFATTETAVGLTFSIYMFGITVGELFYGILSDRFGRKRLLIAGLILFVIATIGCIFSQAIETFTFWRLMQALGVCGPLVIWQAIVVDRFSPEIRHKIFAIVFPMLALSPALAPTIGGFVINTTLWQVIFFLLGVMGLILLLCVLFFLSESTTPASRLEAKIHWVAIKDKYQTLLCSRIFTGYVVTSALTSSAYFCYLTASPFILSDLGYSPVFIGLSYIPQTIAFIVGGLISKKVTDKFGIEFLRIVIYGFLLSAFILLIATTLFPLTTASQIIIPFSIMALLNGILYPSAMNLALGAFPNLAGTAAGLAGSIQSFIIFCVTSITAAFIYFGIMSMSIMIIVLSISALLVFQYMSYRLNSSQP